MARIMKRAASSITPLLLAYRYRTTSSSIFITPQLKNNISRTSLIYTQVLFRTPTRHFSSSLGKKRPSGSDKIICAGEEARHLLKKVVETPSEFPFKIEDKPGEQTVTLTREHMGNYIKVIVQMPDFSTDVNKEENGDGSDDQNDQDKDSVNDPRSSIRLVVTDTNFRGTTLEYGVIAYPNEFSIDSFCIKYAYAPDEENIYYKGPDYAKLESDKNLQKEFHRHLKIIGIRPSTTNFLHEYMANRDMYSLDSSNSPPPTTDQTTPESLLTSFLNDEGIPADPAIEQHRQRGHPLVSAEDIRNSGKNPKDFIWIPYPYHRSETLLWIEVPSKGFYASESDIEEYCNDIDSNLYLDGEAYDANPYRCLPHKAFGDPPVISEEMDKIWYPDLKHANNPKKGCTVALQPYYDEMNKILYPPDGRPEVVEFSSDLDLELYQVYCM